MSEIAPTLDADGQPIVPAEETISLSKKDYDEMVEKLADKTQSNVNLTSEIKELREKKRISETEAEELKRKLETRVEPPASGTELTPAQIAEIASTAVAQSLAQKDVESAKANKEAAIAAFQAKYKEFHPDNDAAGLKFSVLERELATFNLGGLKSQSEFLSVLEKARRLVTDAAESQDQIRDPNPLAPTGDRGTPPRVVTDDKLSDKEKKIIERSFGGDKERYLKIKAKRPDYVESLLQYSL